MKGVKSPSYQHYYKEWYTGTRSLTRQQRDIYRDLLDFSYDLNGLPDNISELEMLCSCKTKSERQDLRLVLEKKFKKDSENLFRNDRLEIVRKCQNEYREKKEISAKKAVAERWKRQREREDEEQDRITIASKEEYDRNTSTSTSTISSSSRKNKKIKNPLAPLEGVVPPFGSEDFLSALSQFLIFRHKQHKFVYADQNSFRIALDRLVEISGNSESTAIAILKKSMANGWSGLFPLDEKEVPVVDTNKKVSNPNWKFM